MDSITLAMPGSVTPMFETSDMTEKVGRERAEQPELRESGFRFSVVSY